MRFKPRHTAIAEAIETPWGVLVREDYFQYPSNESNLYMLAPDGAPLWFAERVMEGDVYANEVRFTEQGGVCCASWNGYDCEIDLTNGKLINAKFTK